MTSIVHKLVQTLGRRRIKQNRQDGTTAALFDAGLRLLARHDHEHVSMARLAREAGCSVGAVYNRFPEKKLFLYHLIGEAFRSLKHGIETIPVLQLWPRRDASSLVKQIVSHAVERMTTRKSAGVIRTTMKLAPTHPLTLEHFDDYRAALTQYAVKVLSPYVGKDGVLKVRVAMQIVLATITDAILQTSPGPLRAGSSRMTAALSNVMCGYLGFETDEAWAGSEAEDEDVPEDYATETEKEPDVPPGHVAMYVPDERVYRGTVEAAKPAQKSRGERPVVESRLAPAKTAKSDSAAMPVVITPRTLKPTSEPDKPRRKHRWI